METELISIKIQQTLVYTNCFNIKIVKTTTLLRLVSLQIRNKAFQFNALPDYNVLNCDP